MNSGVSGAAIMPGAGSTELLGVGLVVGIVSALLTSKEVELSCNEGQMSSRFCCNSGKRVALH